jgi:hypothetical protein
MNRKDIQLLNTLRGYPAVSILLPTHRSAPDNRQDPIRVKNLVRQAAERLLGEFSKREIEPLMARLEGLVQEIDYRHTLDGLALFVNRDQAHAFMLPFPLVERVVIDETFATRDLVFALNRSTRYWALSLSEQHTRLFEGMSDALSEVAVAPFPMKMEGPGATEALPGGKGVEKMTYLEEMRRQFFRHVDGALKPWLASDPLPLVVAGVERYLSLFGEVTAHGQAVAATVTGNHDRMTSHELAKAVWPAVEAAMADRRATLLQHLDNAMSTRNAVSGIGNAWRAAREGRADLLLVEAGFHYPAVVDESGLVLSPSDTAAAPGVIDDAVDEVIEMVLAKGGRVMFADDGALAAHQRIAMVVRY